MELNGVTLEICIPEYNGYPEGNLWEVRLSGGAFSKSRLDSVLRAIAAHNAPLLEADEEMFMPFSGRMDTTSEAVGLGHMGASLYDYDEDVGYAMFWPRDQDEIHWGFTADYAFITGEWSAEGIELLNYAGRSPIQPAGALPRALQLTLGQRLVVEAIARKLLVFMLQEPAEVISLAPYLEKTATGVRSRSA